MLKYIIGSILLVSVFRGLDAEDDWTGISKKICGDSDEFEKGIACSNSLPDSLQNLMVVCLKDVSPDLSDMAVIKDKICGNGGVGRIKVEECFISKKSPVMGTLSPEDLEKYKATLVCLKAIKP